VFNAVKCTFDAITNAVFLEDI